MFRPCFGSLVLVSMLVAPHSALAASETATSVGEGEISPSLMEKPAFCGGEESVLDEIQSSLDETGDARAANRALVTALREGRVKEWDRARAWALLAETQLRLGRYHLAAHNYQRAIARGDAVDGWSDPNWRVGRSIALLRSGRPGAAVKQARAYLDENCAASDPSDPVGCYAAHMAVGMGARDRRERQEALSAAAAVRADNADLEPSFARMRRLFPASRRALLAARAR